MKTPDTHIVATTGIFHDDSYYFADGKGGLTVISPGGWNGDLREAHYPPAEINRHGEQVIKPGQIMVGGSDGNNIVFEAAPADQTPLQ